MFVRFIPISLLILAYLPTFAQDIDISNINKEILKIDSLIEYNQFELVEKKADSLYSLIKNSDYQEQILKVRLQKAIALDKKNEFTEALPIFLDLISKGEEYGFNKIICESNIRLSLIHEKNRDFDLAYNYIKSALEQCKKFGLDIFYSTILIRMSSLHRIVANVAKRKKTFNQGKAGPPEILSFEASFDSSLQYAKQAIPFAEKYHKYKDISDACFLISSYYVIKDNKNLALEYDLKAIPYSLKLGNYEDLFFNYLNVAKKYLAIGKPLNALMYSDSGYRYYNNVTYFDKYIAPLQRSEIFSSMHRADSAYLYMRLAFDDMKKKYEQQKDIDTKKLEKEYQSAKKEETIKTKNRQMFLVICLLGAITVMAVVFVMKNRKINSQNKIINQQVIDLQKTIEQKQILLSELQHRVKNNLQYVISILEIQKESINHNNIEDLIISNQNRIHSIALLHKKLNVTDNVNDVELKRYINDLSELVKDSYDKNENRISLFVECEIEKLPLIKALPLGLIVVELVSNSMKHAFKNRSNGIINIEIIHDDISNKNFLHYIDNGDGFDFQNIATKGLGIEIIKGLIDQLNGKIEVNFKQGFDLKIYF